MKLSQKQQAELTTIKYFIPSWVEFKPITDDDIAKFFGWSDKGVAYQLKPLTYDGLAALHYGKQYRDLQITSWREGIKDGLITKHEILSDLPGNVRSHIERALQGAVLAPDAADFRYRFGKATLNENTSNP